MRSCASRGLQKVAAAVDLNLATVFRFELRDLRGNVALEQDGVTPLNRLERPRRDELRTRIERGSDFVGRVGSVRPRAREDLIGLAAEEKRVGAFAPLGHDLEELVVEEGYQPAAVREGAVAILIRAAGCLHDTVQRQKGAYNEFAHMPSLHLS
jgi:hypothetical protein